jgi:hypothetical protein
MKKLLALIFIIILGILAWFAFAIGIGLYSVYSFPPSKEHREGTTLIVKREPREPMFNSPEYVAPPRKRDEEGTGMGYSSKEMPKRPLNLRTVVELPYVEWAYKKSLEKQKPQ